MVSFTLDTNCMIDVAEERPLAVDVRRLLAAHKTSEADVALVAASASERQLGGDFLSSVERFNERRNELGFGDLEILPSIGRWNISFWDESLYTWNEGEAREELIFSVLFPGSHYEWAESAETAGVDVGDETSRAYHLWRNKILDAQAYWAHEHAKRDIFVTSDQRFCNLHDHPDFPNAIINTPDEAAARL